MPDYRKGQYFPSWRSSGFPIIQPTDGLTDVFEFGVFGGRSMVELSHICHSANVPIERLVGFDSFDGIPKELAEPVKDEWDPDLSETWQAFNARVLYEVDTPLQAMDLVAGFVQRDMVGVQELIMIPGFYEDTLTPELAGKFGKAVLVDLDADIYSSTKTALSWLFKNGLVDTGTYFSYDDWGATPGYMEMLDGESRAHREITEEYGAEWEWVGSCTLDVPNSQMVFRLR